MKVSTGSASTFCPSMKRPGSCVSSPVADAEAAEPDAEEAPWPEHPVKAAALRARHSVTQRSLKRNFIVRFLLVAAFSAVMWAAGTAGQSAHKVPCLLRPALYRPRLAAHICRGPCFTKFILRGRPAS